MPLRGKTARRKMADNKKGLTGVRELQQSTLLVTQAVRQRWRLVVRTDTTSVRT